MRTLIGTIGILTFAAWVSGCSSGVPVRPWESPSSGERTVEKKIPHMNSVFHVRLYLSGEEKFKPGQVLRVAMVEIQRIALMIHPTHPKSELKRVNENAGKRPVKISADFVEMLELAQRMWTHSQGAFNVTFQPGIEKLNNKSLDLIVDRRASTVKFGNPATQLNLYGMARGYALEKAAARIRPAKLAGFMMSAGGLRAVSGSALTDPQVMCIENPLRLGTCGHRIVPSRIPEVLFVGNSASMERRGKLYHPSQDWSYRKGGVIVAGTSGPWAQYAETVTALMNDDQLDEFFRQPGPPKLSGVWFKIEPKSLSIVGALSPYADAQVVAEE